MRKEKKEDCYGLTFCFFGRDVQNGNTCSVEQLIKLGTEIRIMFQLLLVRPRFRKSYYLPCCCDDEMPLIDNEIFDGHSNLGISELYIEPKEED
jgi:hypothetical protein